MCVMVALGAVGCAAEAEDSDETDTGSAASELKLRSVDDLQSPAPLDYPVPEQNPLKRPLWDLRRYLDDPERRPGFDFNTCYQYLMKIFDPARGREIQVPVTVCS